MTVGRKEALPATMTKTWMNDDALVFFDNDCIASFLWIQRVDIVVDLFGTRIRIPSEVIRELERLKHTKSGHTVYRDLQRFMSTHTYMQVSMPITSDIYEMYQRLIDGHCGKRMGSGEASVISHALQEHGIVASNNLKDVEPFCSKYNLELVSTEDILVAAVIQKVISFEVGEKTWSDMVNKKRKLPAYGFTGAWERLSPMLETACTGE